MPRTTPKPREGLAFDPELLITDDLARIVGAIGPVKPLGYDTLLLDLNNAVVTYFVAARFNKFSPAYELESWCNKLAKSAAGTLGALGLSERQAPYNQVVRGIAATLGPDGVEFQSASELGLPDSPYKALVLAANAIAYVQRTAEHAATYHAQRKGEVSKPDLSARQSLIAALGEIYERLTGEKVPKRPNSDSESSPFARFVCAVSELIVKRMVSPAVQATVPPDGTDYVSAKALANLSAGQIADDVRRAVWEKLNPPTA